MADGFNQHIQNKPFALTSHDLLGQLENQIP
jgi:hypothetical protein